MKTVGEVTKEKLRGGFYSPPELVKVCLDRAASLLGGRESVHMLEPSAGDGAFLEGLRHHELGLRVSWATAVELLESEARACGARLENAPFEGEVVQGSVLGWALNNRTRYDLALGNPPFVRFQFVDDIERTNATALGLMLGAEFKGVSNLWLPVLVSALGALRKGGVFAFIVPAESFTGISGYEIRQWLLQSVHELHVDLFPPESFPNVLQEVIVLSGRMKVDSHDATRVISFRQHSTSGVRNWQHNVDGQARTWTRYLLSPPLLGSLEEANGLPQVDSLGRVAKFEVATVTGANGFFCVDYDTVQAYCLDEWTRPLLPRTRHALGLTYSTDDHQKLCVNGLPGYLLDFAVDRADPMNHEGARSYLAVGEAAKLHDRFKCRIRAPWYRVPVVAPGVMMMAKRSHRFPKVVVNDAGVTTTDTIYRGRLVGDEGISSRTFTATFHNSLTLLTAEIEGRSFGGGVLELVPSEVSRLAFPYVPEMEYEFDRLDVLSRTASDGDNEVLIEETDKLLTENVNGLNAKLMAELQQARRTLAELRWARN